LIGLKGFTYSEFVIDAYDYCDRFDYSVFHRKSFIKGGVNGFLLDLIGEDESFYLNVNYLGVLSELFFSFLDILNLCGDD